MVLRHLDLQGLAVASAAAIAVLLLVQIAGTGTPSLSGATARGFNDSPTSLESSQLALAESSLVRGQGPAATAATSSASYRWNTLGGPAGTGPGPRVAPSMTWDPYDGYVLLYGGSLTDSSSGALADTWTYVSGVWTNITATTAGHPPALVAASLAYDPSTHQVILFGGNNLADVNTAQTWAYDDLTWTNLTGTAGTAPSPRQFASMTTDSTDNEIVLVGGDNTTVGVDLYDTWTFKAGTWTNVTATAGLNTFVVIPSVSNDPAQSGVLLAGVAHDTANGTTLHSVTFVYSGGTWTDLTGGLSVEPPWAVAEIASLSWLPAASAVVYSLGAQVTNSLGVVAYASTWEFAGGAWANITTQVGVGQGVSIAFSAAVDPGDSAVISFGGYGLGGLVPFTYLLSAPPVPAPTVSRSVTDVGLPVTFTGIISQGLFPNLPSWTFGDGTNSTNLTETHTYSTAGVYGATLTVTDLVGQSGAASVAVVVNPPMTLSVALAPAQAIAGAAVGLIAVLTGGTSPYTYAWTLGDGATNSTAVITHTYASAGTYLVSLTVTDAIGAKVSVNSSVPVASASAAASPSLNSGTGLLLVIVVVVLVVVVAVLGVLLARKGGGPRAPPVQYAGATGSGSAVPGAPAPPPVAGSPPPGAYAPPPPPPPS